jgi:predicted transcriptional regulator
MNSQVYKTESGIRLIVDLPEDEFNRLYLQLSTNNIMLSRGMIAESPLVNIGQSVFEEIKKAQEKGKG